MICFGLDELAYENSPEDMKKELERLHPWLKIQEVYKVPRSRTIKITCSSADTAI